MPFVDLQIDRNVFNPAYLSFLQAPQRHQVFFGGASSGKSYFLAQRTVLDIAQGGRNYLVARNVAKTLRSSVYNEICKAIDRFGLRAFFRINKSDMVITCKTNGCQILFVGLDDPEKIKSITPAKGILTDVWVEEATEADYKAVKQLEKRLRGCSENAKRLTLSFNPILKDHWIYTDYFGQWDENKSLLRTGDLLVLKTTYKDNRFLAPDDVRALEGETDKYYYDVYTLGNWGVLGAVVFTRWRVENLDGMRKSADNIRCGLDFGFAQDPACFLRTHYDKKYKRIYVLDEVYEFRLTNDVLAERIRPMAGNCLVTCDSAEPKSIEELRQRGINAVPAAKGPDSVNHGIQWLQQHEIIVNVPCQGTRNNLGRYKWREGKDGIIVPVPVDRDNHAPDALRYAYEQDMKNTSFTARTVGRRFDWSKMDA